MSNFRNVKSVTAESLPLRAAYYFGVEDLPRRSAVVGRHTVVIAAREHLYVYDEFSGQRSLAIKLTDKRRADLLALLATPSNGEQS